MILVIGELLIDLVTTELVDDLSATRTLRARVGGSAANFARFSSKLGAEVNLLAAVGKDGLGEMAIEDLEQSGILTANVSRLISKNTSVIVVGRSHGTPEFVPHRDADQYIATVDLKLISGCDVIHSTAFALSREPARTNILSAFESAANHQKKVSVDWNYAEKIWGAENDAFGIFNQVMKYKPLLKMSMDDACRFWNLEEEVDKVKQKLDQFKFELVCLTNGAGGVHYKENGGSWKHKDNLPTTVIDVTGAGDAFWSGFITSFISDGLMDTAVNSALSVAKRRLEQQI